MKKIEWDSTLSVQVEEIDDDHRRLVGLFNLLGRAVHDSEPSDYIDALLEELVSCTLCHFRHEERLMVKYRYPGMARHRADHDSLIASARQLQERCRREARPLSEEDVAFLDHWLTGHILGPDMELGEFLAASM